MIGNKKELIRWLLEQPEEKMYKISLYKNKRSLNQNDFYWHLLNELAKKLKIGWRELHFDMLKNYSTVWEMLVPENTKITGIEYYEKKTAIIKNGKRFNVYHVYTPSHELKTDEFAILLDGLVQECEQQGIETRSPDEIERDSKLYGI